MKLSWANVFCSCSGARSGPLKKGPSTRCDSTRSLATVPAPPAFAPALPTTYEGAVLLSATNSVGAGDGVRGWKGAGSKPMWNPLATLPGRCAPGRPPREADHPSYSHPMMLPCASSADALVDDEGQAVILPGHFVLARKLDAHGPTDRL